MAETYLPSVHEVLERMYLGEYTRRWHVSFDDDGISFCRGDHHRSDDCTWEEMSRHRSEKVTEQLQAEHEQRERRVHMSHCNENNEGTCKYGDADCPALVGHVSDELIQARELTQQAYDRVLTAADALLVTAKVSPYWTVQGRHGVEKLLDVLREQFKDAAANMTFQKVD